MEATAEVFVEPSAIVVALPDDVLVLCHEVLGPRGLRIHRVAHAFAACERIAVLLPRLVVVPGDMREPELEMIEDRAIAVGAVLLHLEPSHPYDSIAAQIEAAADDVRARFSRRSSRVPA